MIREKQRSVSSGWGILGILLAIQLAALYGLYLGIEAVDDGGSPIGVLASITVGVLATLMYPGFFIVNPNEGKVLQLFGAYKGTVRDEGLRWANPLYSKKRVSLRIRNFESAKLKVNDNEGNPIEIAAVVVWRVVDTAEAVFEVHDYENYVHVQTESAVRNLASSYTYDTHDEERVSLRGHTGAVAEHLKREIQDRLSKAGVEVTEARISHLAYAPEIAAAMLQRQQAGAIIAARQRIVEGAVGMVQMALEMLSHRSIVQLDDERKAAMVSNLLVVLCGERGTQPVVNAGTIYQ
jgi:regulator of protease activity HflC (stomatin/prohibitin superfamily)